jgi:hypothetical protein
MALVLREMGYRTVDGGVAKAVGAAAARGKAKKG